MSAIRHWSVLGAALAGALVTASSQAAEDEQALETVVVTAQRRAENLQDVPVAVSALQGDYLINNNIHSLQDLAGAVPSLVVTNSIGYGLAPVTIRGLGGPNGGGSLFTDQPVAVYVDDVYVPTLAQSMSDLVDIDSIQVLRGPQGTLYGRNSTAGAILISSARPDDSFHAEARASFSSFRSVNVSGMLSGPVGSGGARARLACGFNDGNNWAVNQIDGRAVGGGQSQSCRGMLVFHPTEAGSIELIGDFAHSNSSAATVSLVQLTQLPPTAAPTLGAVYAGDPFSRRTDLASVLDSRAVSLRAPQFVTSNAGDATAHVQWRLGKVMLDSITGWRNMNLHGGQDASPGTPTGLLLGYNSSTQKTRSTSEELRLSGGDADSRMKWVAGLFYYRQRNDDVINIVNLQAGAPVATIGGTPPRPIFAGTPSGTTALFAGTQDVNAYAAFADLTVSLTPEWSLTAGGRYSHEHKDAAISQLVQTITPTALAGPTLASGSCPSAVATCQQSYNDFSPRATINFKPAADRLLYFSYARGFNSGGFNTFGSVATPTLATNPLETESETINSYEIGSKNELLQGRLRLNADVFQADYSNLQIRQAVLTGGVAVVNVPKARVKGLEIEGEWMPVNGLTLSLTGSWLDGKITEGTLQALPSNVGSIIFGQNIAVTEQNVAGNALTRAPKWQLRFAPTYRLPTALGTVEVGAAFRYESAAYFSETNQDSRAYFAPAWHEVDLRASLLSFSGHWETALFARNLFDDRHITQIAPYNGFPIATLNTPRVIGIAVTLRH